MGMMGSTTGMGMGQTVTGMWPTVCGMGMESSCHMGGPNTVAGMWSNSSGMGTTFDKTGSIVGRMWWCPRKSRKLGIFAAGDGMKLRRRICRWWICTAWTLSGWRRPIKDKQIVLLVELVTDHVQSPLWHVHVTKWKNFSTFWTKLQVTNLHLL